MNLLGRKKKTIVAQYGTTYAADRCRNDVCQSIIEVHSRELTLYLHLLKYFHTIKKANTLEFTFTLLFH